MTSISSEHPSHSHLPLPEGIITFLFTDIEGSTPLWESQPVEMRQALDQHNAILSTAITENGGVVVKTIGDAFQAAFSQPQGAILAACTAQRSLADATWGATGALKVRMGIHTGFAEVAGDDYLASHTLNRVARIMAAGHGGQVLLSAAIVELIQGNLPEKMTLRDLNDHYLKGMLRPEHIYQLLIPGLPADFPPLSSLSQPAHNLPLQLTSFIGRQAELVKVKQLLLQARLVTLTGSGGVGKTRLSLRAAEELINEFQDGAWLIELAPLGEGELILPELFALFRLREEPGRPSLTVLLDYLRKKNMLLILDNCEHLIEGCAELTEKILRSCAGVHILASSREALGVPGETTFYVPSLASPDSAHMPEIKSLDDFEAVQLFHERAREAQPGFSINEKNASCLVHLTQRLDGIPLALELAAARLRVLSLEQIASRLDDRFRLLTGGSRRALPRHQTLHALIDWSFSLLDDEERTLFRRLSVFSGGWTLEAAERVCTGERITSEGTLDLLSNLVAKSLVIAQINEDGATRYRMLETIRQYAQERLVESEEAGAIRDAHLEYFTHFANKLEPTLRSKDVLVVIEQIDLEIDNLRIALAWGMSADIDRLSRGFQITSAMPNYWILRGLQREGYDWCIKGLEYLPRGDPDLERIRARTDLIAGLMLNPDFSTIYNEMKRLLDEAHSIYQTLGDQSGLALVLAYKAIMTIFPLFGSSSRQVAQSELYREACVLGEQAVALAREIDNKRILMISLYWSANVFILGADYPKARALTDPSLDIALELGDPLFHGWLLDALAAITLYQEEYAASRDLHCQSLEWARKLGYRQGEVTPMVNLGTIAYIQNDYLQMEAWFLKALALAQEAGNRIAVVFSLRMLGFATLLLGKPGIAEDYFLESLPIASEIGDGYGERAFLVGMAGVALEDGNPERSIQLLGAIEAAFEGYIKTIDRWEQIQIDRIRDECHHRMSKADFKAAHLAGKRMTLQQAIGYAKMNQKPSTNKHINE